MFTCKFSIFSFFPLVYGFLLLSCVGGNEMSVIAKATAKHTASLIFLHGLGDTGHGWCASFEEIKMSHVKCICPNAPVNPVTLNGGFRMPSWFDIKSLTFQGEQDETGIKNAAVNIRSIIEDEIKSGIPSDRIVLGGFSQGGALALYTALTMEKPLAGILALSSWLPLHTSFPEIGGKRVTCRGTNFTNSLGRTKLTTVTPSANKNMNFPLAPDQAIKGNKETKILQCHGEMDPVVQFRLGQMTSNRLSTFCSNHEFKTYQGLGHSSSPQEMNDVKEWLKKVLP